MLLAQPLPAEWQAHLARNVAVYALLPKEQQQKLADAARVIAAERRFVGCKGLVVTDEMKLTIAAQAALLLLGEQGYYFDRVTSFLLYPYPVVVPPHGLRPALDEQDPIEQVLLGQAFQQGEIVLSWPDVLHGGRVADDGENVVLHELAHHLDGLDGQMGGSPPGLSPARQDHFNRVFQRELESLRRDLDEGLETLLHPPASESLAELFAYATEAFFELPRDLNEQHPELFACLREFYKLDPLDWFAKTTTHDEATSDELEPDDDPLPASPEDLPPLDTADQYFARGQEFLSLGQWDLAAADLSRCVRLDPTDQEAFVWRGRAYLFQDHVEAALADADRACRLDPDDVEAHALRAMCLAAQERYREALDAFSRAGNAVADDAEALFLRGIARGACGQWQQALSDFCEVLDMHPDDAEAWFERAQCHLRLGQVEQADRDLARARELGWNGDDTG